MPIRPMLPTPMSPPPSSVPSTPTDPPASLPWRVAAQSRGRLRGPLVLGTVAVLTLAVGFGAGALVLPGRASSGRGAPVSDWTAGQVLAAAASTAQKRHGVHVSLTSTGSGDKETTVEGDLLRDAFHVRITSGSQHVEEILVRGTVYVRGTAGELLELGIPAGRGRALGEVWVRVSPADLAYGAQAEGTLPDMLRKFVNGTDPELLASAKGLDGTDIVTVVAKSSDGSDDELLLSVSEPGMTIVQAQRQSRNGEADMIFSHWDEKVAISAPKTSVPLASVDH